MLNPMVQSDLVTYMGGTIVILFLQATSAPEYELKVYLTRDMKDKLTPVIISIDFALAEGETEMEHLSNQPVIRINGDKHVTKSINIKNNCRLHNFCDDNLKGWFQSLIQKFCIAMFLE